MNASNGPLCRFALVLAVADPDALAVVAVHGVGVSNTVFFRLVPPTRSGASAGMGSDAGGDFAGVRPASSLGVDGGRADGLSTLRFTNNSRMSFRLGTLPNALIVCDGVGICVNVGVEGGTGKVGVEGTG